MKHSPDASSLIGVQVSACMLNNDRALQKDKSFSYLVIGGHRKELICLVIG